jgi:translocation protein SEC63
LAKRYLHRQSYRDTFDGEYGSLTLKWQLKVEMPAERLSDDEDDISEPEEDSLAGQMAMMRGGAVKTGGTNNEFDYDSDEYETSSDEEGPRKGKAINEDSDSDSD